MEHNFYAVPRRCGLVPSGVLGSGDQLAVAAQVLLERTVEFSKWSDYISGLGRDVSPGISSANSSRMTAMNSSD